jgi:fructokinase
MQPPRIICIGELLADLISTEYADTFARADQYRRVPGGSPANLAMNLARLGIPVGLVATVGRDDTGALLSEAVAEAGVQTAGIRRVAEPTTLVLVTKSRAVSNFEAYRLADPRIDASQIPDDWLAPGPILHTTAFALSREPARTAILTAARRVTEAGGQLSIDLNYAPKIWPDRLEALWVITQYLSTGGAGAGAMVKCSEVDYLRLFGEPPEDHSDAAAQLRDLGAGLVCLTLGEKGSYTSAAEGQGEFLEARPVDVVDTTGAGDAFWSGFLAAYVSGTAPPECARAGRAVAERKLTCVGTITESLDWKALLS